MQGLHAGFHLAAAVRGIGNVHTCIDWVSYPLMGSAPSEVSDAPWQSPLLPLSTASLWQLLYFSIYQKSLSLCSLSADDLTPDWFKKIEAMQQELPWHHCSLCLMEAKATSSEGPAPSTSSDDVLA